jgi:hypothetical protein
LKRTLTAAHDVKILIAKFLKPIIAAAAATAEQGRLLLGLAVII